MPNPYLPNWEYIPDGEPRVFGNRVYIYGSHDRVASDVFCDYKLKVWSASVDDLNHWVCHGDAFHSREDEDHKTDVEWSSRELFAPDVVEKDGKYYMYVYIVDSPGCVAVSDRPEGPFTLLSQYEHRIPEEICEQGAFIDPGVLVDDDGRVYIYCGFLHSFMAELSGDTMYQVVEGSCQEDIIPKEEPFGFFEACSPRKVGNTYYLIYSPSVGSRLAYATSDSPTGPFTYRGYIIDNGQDYPGGNDHGSICKIKDQWYIFYHRMTNGTIMSRRGCVEPITILEDGTIPTVEMTSMGFEKALNPYEIQQAEIACVLKGGCIVTQQDTFSRVIANITDGCVMGYKYFDFGQDYSGTTMTFQAKVTGLGLRGRIHILLDGEEGEEIGVCPVETGSGVISCPVKNVTGRHSVFLKAEVITNPPFDQMFNGRSLCLLHSFVFMK